MSPSSPGNQDIVVIGGGVSGLSISALLAREGLPVTLLEASDLGFCASTRNQGWLYSGAYFAPRQADLARMCYESYEQTVRFCPECLEPGHTGMVFAATDDQTDVDGWTSAWADSEIPFDAIERGRLSDLLPEVDHAAIHSAFHLPDRSFRPEVLLKKLADVATTHGARLHTRTRVTDILSEEEKVTAVRTSNGDKIRASFVIVATGANRSDLGRYLTTDKECMQSLYHRITLQTHLISVTPQLSRQPFCLVDCGGFNHMPHTNTGENRVSVFGMDNWKVINPLEAEHICADATKQLRANIERWFPAFDTTDTEINCWSGTTVQAMQVEQIDPGRIPIPTVIDHLHESPSVANMISVYPGRATLWIQLAREAATIVMDRLERTHNKTATPPWA